MTLRAALLVGGVVGAIAPGALHSAQASGQETRQAVDSAVRMALAGHTVTVMPAGATRMPACTSGLTATAMPSMSVNQTVAVSCLSPQWTLYAQAVIVDRVSVPVLLKPVAGGTLLTVSDVSLQTFPASAIHGTPLSLNQLASGGVTVTLPLAAGAPLTSNDTAIPPVIRSGQPITIIVHSAAGITINTSGRALQNGGIGQMIEVENPGSHKRFDAIVTTTDPGRQGVFALAQ